MHWLPILRMRPLTFLHEPLAGLISLQTLQNVLSVWGYPAVTLFIMIESAGIPFPGETMLLLASFSAATIDPQLNIVIIIACAAFGAIIGDNAGYYIGRTGGRAIVVLAVLIFIMLRLRSRRKMARLSTTNATSQAEQSRDRTTSSKSEP